MNYTNKPSYKSIRDKQLSYLLRVLKLNINFIHTQHIHQAITGAELAELIEMNERLIEAVNDVSDDY